MKTTLLILAGTCLSSLALAQSDPMPNRALYANSATETLSEATANFVYFMPSQQHSGFYDRMLGMEFQYTYWLSRPFGLTAMAGIMSADVRTDNRQLVDPQLGTFEDSAQMIPIGVSALYNVVDNGDWRVDAEAGLRYVFIDSSIQLKSVETGARENVDLEDAVAVLLRANVYRRLADNLALYMSAGVQNDVVAGDITTSAGKLGDDNLKGYSLSLGLTYAF